MKRVTVWLLLALVSQAVPPAAFAWIAHSSYEARSIDGSTEDQLTRLALLVGAAGLVLGALGTRSTILRLRPWLAASVVLGAWTPLCLSAAVHAYAYLVFRLWA